jgi:hypothetical protein
LCRYTQYEYTCLSGRTEIYVGYTYNGKPRIGYTRNRCTPSGSLSSDFHSFSETLEVVGHRLAEAEEEGEQLGGGSELDFQPAGSETDGRGKGSEEFHGLGGFDADLAGLEVAAQAVELIAEAIAAADFELGVLPIPDGLEFGDQIKSGDEEGGTGGGGGEAVEDAEGLAGADMEEGLKGEAVDEGGGEEVEFGEGGVNVVNPFGFTGHGRVSGVLYMYWRDYASMDFSDT